MTKLGLIGMGIANQAVLKHASKHFTTVLTYDSQSDNNTLHTTDQVDVICIASGIAMNSITDPVIQQLIRHSIIVNDIELFYRFYSPFTIAITGTYGKSTTAQLIANMLNTHAALGHTKNTQLLGNIGVPIWEWDGTSNIVLELSSAQLELLTSLRAEIGVLTNIHSHHLSRYNSYQKYVYVKHNLRKMSRKWIENTDHDPDYQMRLAAKVVQMALPAEYDPLLYQQHEVPLPFRMQAIAPYIINDSKSTGSHATAFALHAIRTAKPIVLICGGRLDEFDDWNVDLSKAHVLIFFGQAGPKLHKRFGGTLIKSIIDLKLTPYTDHFILFSPGCQSWDEFDNFEHRGRIFNHLLHLHGFILND